MVPLKEQAVVCLRKLKLLIPAAISAGSCYGSRMAVYVVLMWNVGHSAWLHAQYDQEVTYRLIAKSEDPHFSECYAWADVHCNSTDYLRGQKESKNILLEPENDLGAVWAVVACFGGAAFCLDCYLALKQPIFIAGVSSLSLPTQAWKVLMEFKGGGKRIWKVATILLFSSIPLLAIGALWYVLVRKSPQIIVHKALPGTGGSCICAFQYEEDWGRAQFLNSIAGSILLSLCFLRCTLCWVTGTIYSNTCFLSYKTKENTPLTPDIQLGGLL